MLPGSPGLIDNIASQPVQVHSLNWYLLDVFLLFASFFSFFK